MSRVAALADAQVLYGSRPRHRGVGPGARASDALLGDVWRERGFGDFWGYALLAEGAAEAMVEVGPVVRGTRPRRWSSIEEAGGRVTDFDGRRAIDSGTFLASNGLLHDEVLGRLRGPR